MDAFKEEQRGAKGDIKWIFKEVEWLCTKQARLWLKLV